LILFLTIGARPSLAINLNYSTSDFPGFAGLSVVNGISGNTIFGAVQMGVINAYQGAVYNGSTLTLYNDPLAAQYGPSGYGTIVTGISGSNVVGYYLDSVNAPHGFLYNGTNYTTLDNPLANFQGTVVTGISGNNIIGYYHSDTAMNYTHGFIFNGSSF